MVTVTNYLQKENAEGKAFFMLELTGELEIVVSQTTGKPYATVRKVSIPTTLDENMCKLMLGKQMPGQIAKVEVEEAYDYTNKETGEVLSLNYRYEYSATEKAQTMEQAVFQVS
ncbi:hypothetical protein FYC62_14955 [Pedobacter aquae]|uniref:Uncharacterized protein n=1 Tax=Pedobacter aquae TaxID=2605747 RepID=A0A5C0VKY5_9SPHI|nr:hypothetical protein [Pedobacter aquae]QEK52817.1 hypothetical protein FYC62_14955 [Pedobacter aquae]